MTSEALAIDLHTHLMPLVDDGSRGAVETIAMARGLADLGVTRVHLTPHQFRFGNAFAKEELERRTEQVRRLLEEADVRMEVVAGAEYLYGQRLFDALEANEELVTFPLAGERCILIELPLRQPSFGVERVGSGLLDRGIRPILAHPERCLRARRHVDRLYRWREKGWWTQLNLRSLIGDHGPLPDYIATKLVLERAYDAFGSDIHRASDLPGLREARERCRGLLSSGARS